MAKTGTENPAILHLHNNGPFLPLGHKAVPPSVPKLFSAPRFTPQQQTERPDLPMTRLIKDVARPGTWKGRVVSSTDLQGVKNSFDLAQSRGVAFNLGKGHGDPRTGLIHPDDLISPIDELQIEGETLWMSVYVTPTQAKQLLNPASKVSAGIRWDFQDGAGNKYPITMIHAAITDHPVIPAQGPFLNMCNSGEASGIQNFAKLVVLINRILPGEVKLPGGVQEDELVAALENTVDTLEQVGLIDPLTQKKGESGDSTKKGGTIETMPGDKTPGVDFALALQTAVQKAVEPLQNQVLLLSNQVAALKGENVASAEEKFTTELDTLCKAGLPAGRRDFYLNLGKRLEWDESVLDGARNEKGIDMSNVIKPSKTAKAPDIAPNFGDLTDEQLNEAAKELGCKPKETSRA